MNGVGGNHQPVNLTPTNNGVGTQNTQSSQGLHGRFKVTLAKVKHFFFGGLPPSQLRNVSIQSRTITAPPPLPSTAGMNSNNINNAPDAAKNSNNIDNALDAAKNSPEAKQSFEKVHKGMEEFENLKKNFQQLSNNSRDDDDRNHAKLDMEIAKGQCKKHIENFNKTVEPELHIDFYDLEMALGNQADLDANLDYPEFDQEFKALSNYRAMSKALL